LKQAKQAMETLKQRHATLETWPMKARLANSAACLDLDYIGLDEEVEIDLYESHKIYMATRDNTQAATEDGSSTSRSLPCLSNALMLDPISA
jgi:hypothetical protein